MSHPAAEPTLLGTMFRLLSVAFRPPTRGLAELVATGAIADDVRATWGALELDGASAEAFCAGLAGYAGRPADEVMHELRRENTRLFLGSRPLVANSEGPWRKKAEGKEEVALMVNSYSTEVADFMRYCGVVRADGYNDCVDYVENECDFAGLLSDGPAYLAERGMDAVELLERFVGEHMKLWVPGFCADVLAATECPYYRALCGLTRSFVDEL